ncbi:MAG: hypothetical protein U5K36_15170 [Roseovarius sp.]|nr:hypothetical protein [Roseovarius sp.]
MPAWRDWPRVFDRVALRNMASVNTDILLRSLMLQAIFVSFLFLGAGFGDVTLAANQVLMQFLNITALCARRVRLCRRSHRRAGSRRAPHRGAAARRGAGQPLGAGCLCWRSAVAYAVLGRRGDRPDDHRAPRCAPRRGSSCPDAVAAPLLGLRAFMLDGVFIGATAHAGHAQHDGVEPCDLRAWRWLALVPVLGQSRAVGWRCCLSFVARGVTLGLRYPALERGMGSGVVRKGGEWAGADSRATVGAPRGARPRVGAPTVR